MHHVFEGGNTLAGRTNLSDVHPFSSFRFDYFVYFRVCFTTGFDDGIYKRSKNSLDTDLSRDNEDWHISFGLDILARVSLRCHLLIFHRLLRCCEIIANDHTIAINVFGTIEVDIRQIHNYVNIMVKLLLIES